MSAALSNPTRVSRLYRCVLPTCPRPGSPVRRVRVSFPFRTKGRFVPLWVPAIPNPTSTCPGDLP
jgi:hypothetical protein